MNERLWLSPPHMGKNELKYVEDAFNKNWIAPLGENVDKFEEVLCTYTGSKNSVALSSGTAAIHLALILSNITKDDYVLCSTFTFSASVNPILYVNATPIFVDSENDTWNICPKLLEEAIVDSIKQNKKPKALILVHLYGMPCKMNEILEICSKYKIILIEDAAEAVGSSYNGQMLGTFGEFGILSFNGNKIITTSAGGALLTPSREHADKARFLSTQARDPAPHYEHSEIGYNYRMSNILAGIGRGQMEVIADRVISKRNIYEFYKNELSSIKDIIFTDEPRGFHSNRWLTTILLKSADSEQLRLHLEKSNIESRPLWKPMHNQPIFSTHPKYLNGNSEMMFKKGLCLPSGSAMTNESLHIVTNAIKEFYK